jgi:undecaprenyl-diphosphatase
MTAKTAKKIPSKPAAAAPLAPTQPVYYNRRPWYIAMLIVGVLLLAASLALVLTGRLDGLELKIFTVVNHANLPDWVANQLAKPLSNAVYGMVALVVVLLAFPKYRLLSWQYVVAIGSAYVSAFVIAELVGRARPLGLAGYEAIARATQGGPGYPSGHVAVITALGLTIWPLVSWPWRVFILLLIGAEAWSRVFLGVHAPLDVVGGCAVGLTVVALIHLTPAKIRRFFKISA